MKNKVLKGKVREGHFCLVENKNPYPTANKKYVQGTIEWDHEKVEAIQLFTEHEIEVAKKRAKRKENLIPKGSSLIKSSTRFGHISFVKNKKKTHFSESNGYYFVKMHHFKFADCWYCFTPKALTRSLQRTVKNKEDIVAKNLLTDLFD